MSSNMPNLTIATYNTDLQFTHSIYLYEILSFCTQQKIKILLLQETGKRQPTLPNQYKHKWQYIANPPTHRGHSPNHTTGILLHKSLSNLVSDVVFHDSGRYTSIVLNLRTNRRSESRLYIYQLLPKRNLFITNKSN